MPGKLMTFSNGEYTFAETEVKNQFLFYRNDGGVIGDVGRLPMDFYQNYVCTKMFNGELTEMVMKNIYFETSTDGKCMRLTAVDIGSTLLSVTELNDADVDLATENETELTKMNYELVQKKETKKSNFFRRLFSKK